MVKFLGLLIYFLLHWWIPMILDRIISSTFQYHCNLGPFVALLSVRDEKDPLLFFAPDALLDLWVQMIMPSFSTLLANTARETVSNLSPFLRSFLLYKNEHKLIFFFAPGSFNQIRVQDLLPSVQTLDIGATRQCLCNFLPILASILLDSSCKHLVFGLGPMTLGWPVLVLGGPGLV